MAALVHAASRRFLRLRAYGSSTNTGTISQDAVNLRVWQGSHVEAQEAPGVSRRATVSRNSLLKCKFSYSSQMADTCYPQGLAFWRLRQLRQPKSHYLFGHERHFSSKLKPLSSWKRRFQITSDGKYIRKQKGKRHKSFSKSRKRRLRLRTSKLVHRAFMSPIKKMGFALH